MASEIREKPDETACDKCGAPASWADTSNLSWKQSLRHHLSNYFLSPRMWPIGYILQSPYSPFWLEIEVPTHNWRDAFEDLLALESGGEMISLESRNKESEVAKHIRHNNISHNVSLVNDQLKHSARYMSLLKRWRDLAAREDRTDTLESIAEAIPLQEESSKQTIAAAEGMIATLEQNMGKSFPASSYKMRGQWMASLVSSGALPGWQAKLFESSEGLQVGLFKTDGDQDDPDGQRMTELEIMKQFEEGIPMQLGNPIWSTDAGHYPEPKQISEVARDDVSITYVEYPTPPVAPSVLSQATTVERSKSENGDLSTKVTLRNLLTDGTTEQKEVTNDSSKVLEEIHRVYASMQARGTAINVALQEAQYDSLYRQLEEHEEMDELD